jgi:hypothetical protein
MYPQRCGEGSLHDSSGACFRGGGQPEAAAAEERVPVWAVIAPQPTAVTKSPKVTNLKKEEGIRADEWCERESRFSGLTFSSSGAKGYAEATE